MRLVIFLIFVNIVLMLFVFYTVNIGKKDVQMEYLPNVLNLNIDEGLELLDDFEVNVLYIESKKDKDFIVSSDPKPNSLVYENQVITLYISAGNNIKRYDNLENQMYEDSLDYINFLIKKHEINVIISYINDLYMVDGLIYRQISEDEFIDRHDKLELVVVKNERKIVLPSFIGWYYKDVIKYANKNSLIILFEYIDFLYQEDYVVGQSIDSGTEVLKNSSPIIIYLAK